DRRVTVTTKEQSICAFAARDIPNVYITDDRRINAGVAFFVKEIDCHDRFGHPPDPHVSHAKTLHNAPPYPVRLDAQRTPQTRAVHAAMFSEYVSGAAGYFASDRDAAVTILHRAVADNDVLDGYIDSPTVIVPTRLQRNAIISGVK